MNSSARRLARLLCARVVRALLGQRRQYGVEVLADRGHAARDFLRIRAGVDDLVLGVVVVGFLFVALFPFRHDLDLGRVLRLRDHVGRIRVDETDHQVDHACLASLELLVGVQHVFMRGRITGERQAHGVEAFLDALGNANFALARQQLDRAHLAHVHAHRVGGAAELGVERRQRGRSLFDGFLVCGRGGVGSQERLRIRCFLVHRNAHVVNGVDDVFDLFGIDDLGRQVIVDLGVGEVTLFLAACNQELQLRLAVFGHAVGAALNRGGERGSLGRRDGRLADGWCQMRTGVRRRLRRGHGSGCLAACPRVFRSGPGGERLGRLRAGGRRNVCSLRRVRRVFHGRRSVRLPRRGRRVLQRRCWMRAALGSGCWRVLGLAGRRHCGLLQV